MRDLERQEKLSSAFTLSDMEIFIFPELFYPLILSNIMSPEIWKWRDDPWFRDIEDRKFISRANRIKQYIIDNYAFNLDLDTWGLTTKEKEIDRFKSIFDIELLKKSNALFGYEGDSYYFDIDIRKHFGLDRFDSDVIPYWKTETVEAMNAFRYKEGFSSGAGECVSLSALYGAALFIVGRVPLEKIFMMATPLHSQNFVDDSGGLLTNNRRIVTKNMWYNGTTLSEKARRALENEKVTIVSHITGHIHTLNDKATIDPQAYRSFCSSLSDFLSTHLTVDIFMNFLRAHNIYRKEFQYRVTSTGNDRYIKLERIYEYEHSSRFKLSKESRKRLINEIDGDEFTPWPINGRYMLNDLEELISNNQINDRDSILSVLEGIGYSINDNDQRKIVDDLLSFISTKPDLPDEKREFKKENYPLIGIDDTREQIVLEIKRSSRESEMSMLALYVSREMEMIEWEPFIKAACERNPVSLGSMSELETSLVFKRISELGNDSIYEGSRLAMPDEVWNFGRGDGIEKAFLMASILVFRQPQSSIMIDIRLSEVVLKTNGSSYVFTSLKGLSKRVSIDNKRYLAEQV